MPPGGMQAWSVFGTIGLNGLGAATAKLNAFNSMGKATSTGLLGLNGKAAIAAAGLTAFGVAAGAAGVASVNAFADFDEKMTSSLAIMDDVSDAMEGRMSDAAREVARTTQFSAEQAAEAYFFLASAGLDAQQSIAAMPQVAAFATAGQFDLATATDLLTDAQSALGLKAKSATANLKNMARVSDVLVRANTLANASVEQFSQALTTQAGASLKAFNKDVEEGVAVLAAMADQGIKAQRAGTGLSRLIRYLSKNWTANKKEFQKLKISVFDGQGEFNNLATIIGQLEDALGDMTPEMKAAKLEQLGFTARIQQTILPLLGTSDAIRTYEQRLQNAGSVTQSVADKQLDTINKQLGLLKSALADIGIEIGEVFGPSVIRKIEDFRIAVNKANDTMQTFRDSFEGSWFDRMADQGERSRRAFEEMMRLRREGLPVPKGDQFFSQQDKLIQSAKRYRASLEEEKTIKERLLEIDSKTIQENLALIDARMEAGEPVLGGDPVPDEGVDDTAQSEADRLVEKSRELLGLASARQRTGVKVGETWVSVASVHEQINNVLKDRAGLTNTEESALRNASADATAQMNRMLETMKTAREISAPDVEVWDEDIITPPHKIKAGVHREGRETGQTFIDGFKEEIGDGMVRAGEQIIYGLIQGTVSVQDVLKRVFASVLTSAIMGPLASIFAFGSPSKMMAERGRDIVLGLAQGITGAASVAEMAMADVAGRVSGKANAMMPAVAGMPTNVVRGHPGGFGSMDGLRVRLDGPDIPAPTDPRQAARDREWQKMFRDSMLVAESDGFRRR